jgi:hypothetical protein
MRAAESPRREPADGASCVAVGLALIAPVAAAVHVADPGHVTLLLAVVALAGSLLVGPAVAWYARVWIMRNDAHPAREARATSVARTAIGSHDAAVMLACGVTFCVIALRWATSWSGVIVAVLATGVLTIGTVDVAVHRIPTVVVRLTAAAVSLAVIASAATGQRPGAVAGALAGALGLWGY